MLNWIKQKLSNTWNWTKRQTKKIIWFIFGITIIGATGATQLNLINSEPIKFPLTANTLTEKLEYAYASQEKLRLEHNEMGRQYREGIITKTEWKTYLDVEFDPLNRELSYFIGPNREKVMKELLNVTSTDPKDEIQQDVIHDFKEQFKQSKKWKINTANLLK